MPNLDGPGLIVRAQGGDVDAIGALYDQHHESIFRYVWLRVGDRHLAEDLTGDVFMRMLNALPGYRSVGLPFRAWLYRIAHNLLIDHYRTTGNRSALPLEDIEDRQADDADPPAAAEHTLLVERLQTALSKLDPPQRDVVALRFVSGLSLRETALALDKTEAAVKSLQHRGLAALRLALREEQQVTV
jgi:RNA polymerase sigma-70 factor (ECF subfamily)